MASIVECKTSYVSGWKNAFDYKSKSSRLDFLSFLIGSAVVGFCLSFASAFLSSLSAYLMMSSGGGIEDLLSSVLQVLSQIINIGIFLFAAGFFVASISLSVRRLRGMGRSLWWMILEFIPFLSFVFIIWLCVSPSKN